MYRQIHVNRAAINYQGLVSFLDKLNDGMEDFIHFVACKLAGSAYQYIVY